MKNIIDYIIFRFATEYVANKYLIKKENYDTEINFVEFNRINDLGKLKINLLPFIITMANGDRDYFLDEIFKKFEKKEIGFIDSNFASESNLKLEIHYESEHFIVSKYKTTVKSSYKEILNSFSTKNEVYDKIDNSINHIKFNHSKSFFWEYNVLDMSIWHTYNRIFNDDSKDGNLYDIMKDAANGVLYQPVQDSVHN
jgi:hypothetical protein